MHLSNIPCRRTKWGSPCFADVYHIVATSSQPHIQHPWILITVPRFVTCLHANSHALSTASNTTTMANTHVVIGASRGIGLEYVKQLLTRGDQVIAAVRDPTTANQLWKLTDVFPRPGSCLIEQCDMTSEASIKVASTFQPKTYPR
jgi:hypothetical protein